MIVYVFVHKSSGPDDGGNETPVKKAKIILTEEEEKFDKQFHPVASKMDKPRKIDLRHVSGRGVSMKKQGARKHDVKSDTWNRTRY